MTNIKFDNVLCQIIEEEADKCIGCKLCMRGCPMLDKFTSNPKELLSALNSDLDFPSNMPYSCMLCGYCEEICPKDVSFKNLFFKMRQRYIDENGGNIIEFPNPFDGVKPPKSISPAKHKTEPIMPTINNFLFTFINILV